MQNDCTPINFSDDALRAADEITLSQLMEAPGIKNQSAHALIRCVEIMRDQMSRSVEPDLDTLRQLNALRQALGQEVMDLVFTKPSTTPIKKEPAKREVPLKLLTQAQAKEIVHSYVQTVELRFTRQEVLKHVLGAQRWGNPDAVGSMVDNALQALQREQMVMCLPSQQGTWLVQSALQFGGAA